MACMAIFRGRGPYSVMQSRVSPGSSVGNTNDWILFLWSIECFLPLFQVCYLTPSPKHPKTPSQHHEKPRPPRNSNITCNLKTHAYLSQFLIATFQLAHTVGQSPKANPYSCKHFSIELSLLRNARALELYLFYYPR